MILPIVTRELRLAARRRRTYYERMLVAAVWAAIAGCALAIAVREGFVSQFGRDFFTVLAVGMSIWAIVSGWSGFDTLSGEKRAGTLGFLFLTDLTGTDVVLGKLASVTLPSFYELLAALPLLAVCLLFGGITAAEFFKTGLAVLSLFFFSKCVTILSSTIFRQAGNVGGFIGLAMFFYFFIWLTGEIVGDVWRVSPLPFLIINPVFPIYCVLDGNPGVPAYWISLTLVYLQAWLLLKLACRRLPHSWQDRHPRPSLWKRCVNRLRPRRPANRLLARERLDLNAFFWLAGRKQPSSTGIWICFSLITGGTALVAFLARRNFHDFCGPLSVFMIMVLHFALKMGILGEGSRLLEFRQSGLLEAVLCGTPFSERDILRGLSLHLRRLYTGPVIGTLVVSVILAVLAHFTFRKDDQERNSLMHFAIGSGLVFPTDMVTLALAGMRSALSRKKLGSAVPLLLLWISLGQLFLLIILANAEGRPRHPGRWMGFLLIWLAQDLVICWLLARELRIRFRRWVVPNSPQTRS